MRPHRGHGFGEAPLRSSTVAMTSKGAYCAPAQGTCLQRGFSAILHRGHKYKGPPVRSRTAAMASKRPLCAPAKGHDFKEAPVCPHTEAM